MSLRKGIASILRVALLISLVLIGCATLWGCAHNCRSANCIQPLTRQVAAQHKKINHPSNNKYKYRKPIPLPQEKPEKLPRETNSE